jgi:predicted Zn-dependent protease with MMP-like domain
MNRDRFGKLVAQAVEGLPEEFREKLENIDVVIEDVPSRAQLRQTHLKQGLILLGLYEGVPLTSRTSNYGMVPPDKITIFQKNIEAKCVSSEENTIRDEVQRTVLHEIAHHFGIGDTRLKQIEDGKKEG